MSFDINEYYSKLNGGDVLMAFKGSISSELISNVLEVVESRLDEYDESSKIRKKVYNVLVESLQNLYHHIEVLPKAMQKEYDDKFGIIKIEFGILLIWVINSLKLLVSKSYLLT